MGPSMNSPAAAAAITQTGVSIARERWSPSLYGSMERPKMGARVTGAMACLTWQVTLYGCALMTAFKTSAMLRMTAHGTCNQSTGLFSRWITAGLVRALLIIALTILRTRQVGAFMTAKFS